MLVLISYNITPQKSFPSARAPPELETVVTKVIDAQHFLTCLLLIKAYFN